MATITLYRCGHCRQIDCFTTLRPTPKRTVTGAWYLTLTCLACGWTSGLPCADEGALALRPASYHLPAD